MASSRSADIVFCLDSSGSMQPCFDGVQQHITDFLTGLNAGQAAWDVRFDYVAYNCTQEPTVFPPFLSVRSNNLLDDLYGANAPSKRLFTTDAELFRLSLRRLTTQGDEASLVGLDFALDFPWRDAAMCHRVVILMTDEPFETGVYQTQQEDKLEDLMHKVEQLRVLLLMVTPESEVFDRLSEIDRCERIVVQGGDGLQSVDFAELLMQLGKSVSVSTLQSPLAAPAAKRGLFDQPLWRPTQGGALRD